MLAVAIFFPPSGINIFPGLPASGVRPHLNTQPKDPSVITRMSAMISSRFCSGGHYLVKGGLVAA